MHGNAAPSTYHLLVRQRSSISQFAVLGEPMESRDTQKPNSPTEDTIGAWRKGNPDSDVAYIGKAIDDLPRKKKKTIC
jgi:hypothetical protein